MHYHKIAYGITGKLVDGYWLIGVICGVIFLASLTIFMPEKWYMWLFCSLFVVWSGALIILIPIFLLELLVWYIFHPKNIYKPALSVVGIALILCTSGWLSTQIPRVIATCFANENYNFWENCYISESPNATKFHYSPSCRYLRLSEYEVEVYDVYDAEDIGFKPCKGCLKQSKEYQYDVFIPFLFLPVTIFMFWLIFRVTNMCKKYKMRNPIAKR